MRDEPQMTKEEWEFYEEWRDAMYEELYMEEQRKKEQLDRHIEGERCKHLEVDSNDEEQRVDSDDEFYWE